MISSSSKGRKTGRKTGTKKRINSEIVSMIDTIEILLIACVEQLELVATRCGKSDKKRFRNGESCKNKIEKISFMENPTDTVDNPLSTLRTKAMKKKTSSNETIGNAE